MTIASRIWRMIMWRTLWLIERRARDAISRACMVARQARLTTATPAPKRRGRSALELRRSHQQGA